MQTCENDMSLLCLQTRRVLLQPQQPRQPPPDRMEPPWPQQQPLLADRAAPLQPPQLRLPLLVRPCKGFQSTHWDGGTFLETSWPKLTHPDCVYLGLHFASMQVMVVLRPQPPLQLLKAMVQPQPPLRLQLLANSAMV